MRLIILLLLLPITFAFTGSLFDLCSYQNPINIEHDNLERLLTLVVLQMSTINGSIDYNYYTQLKMEMMNLYKQR